MGATGSLNPAWSLFAAYTYLDGRILESNRDFEVGNRIRNAPKHSGNLWLVHRMGRLSAGGAGYASSVNASGTLPTCAGWIGTGQPI